jgi:predicted RNA-binding Zn-ribbon protein involved in translation (DUF1610 family)
VLNPGEDVTIDRFLDDKSKMLFETYSYDANNKAAANAVAENGIVQVNFFKEKKVQRPNVKLKSARSRGITGQSFDTYGSTFTTNNLVDDGSDYATLHNVGGMGQTLTSNNIYFSQSLDDGEGITLNGDVTLDGNVTVNGDLNVKSSSLDFASDPLPEEKKETGRVEKGNESNQNFHEVQIEFEYYAFHTVTYNLKPTSERGQTTVNETKVRDYCPNCGYRIRNTRWNFCPKCGDEV